MLADMTVEKLKQFILYVLCTKSLPGNLFVLLLRNPSLGILTNLEGLPEIYQIQYTFSKETLRIMYFRCTPNVTRDIQSTDIITMAFLYYSFHEP